MKNINWWKVLKAVLHILTFGLAKLETIVSDKASKRDVELTKQKLELK